MMNKPDPLPHYHIELVLLDYIQKNTWISNQLVEDPVRILPLMDRALLGAQQRMLETHSLKRHLSVKLNCHVRLCRPGDCEELVRTRVPRCEDVGRLVFFNGTVIRTGMVKMVETQKTFECAKCGERFQAFYDRELFNAIKKPVVCPVGKASGARCKGDKFKEIPNGQFQCDVYGTF
jgi:DNA helicase MCM9